MKITMVKKVLTGGSPCDKCRQSEELLKKRNLWDKIDKVIIADENDPDSPGMKLAKQHSIKLAPFYIVDNISEKDVVYTSTLKLIKEVLTADKTEQQKDTNPTSPQGMADITVEEKALEGAAPAEVCSMALDRFGRSCAIAFSGAEDVVLIDICSRLGLPFSVFSLDTGRLHPETYRFIDKVRSHYGIQIRIMSPNRVLLEPFIEEKGLFSFYDDGHKECCGIRKVEPLKRALSSYRAWMTGQRKDQSPATRGGIPHIEIDGVFKGPEGSELYKFNPLADWSLSEVWEYIRTYDVPHNELHDRGFVSIGCEPCTRPPKPGEHERAGRWWWEEDTKRECGLHVKD
jgi:phosphoadenosine phosphosulfate reductase